MSRFVYVVCKDGVQFSVSVQEKQSMKASAYQSMRVSVQLHEQEHLHDILNFQ